MNDEEVTALLCAEPEGTFLTLVYTWTGGRVITEVYRKGAADRWSTHSGRLYDGSWSSRGMSDSLGFIGSSAIWSLS